MYAVIRKLLSENHVGPDLCDGLAWVNIFFISILFWKISKKRWITFLSSLGEILI